MPQEMIINVSPTGSVVGLHFDDFDLGFLGKKEIKRASEIVFNEDTQKWDIHLPNSFGPVCEATCHFGGYDTARTFEVSWLQECMKYRCLPDSEQGKVQAAHLRYGK